MLLVVVKPAVSKRDVLDRPLEASLTESFARSYHWKDGVADNDIHYSQSPGSDPPAGGLWNGGKLGRVEA